MKTIVSHFIELQMKQEGKEEEKEEEIAIPKDQLLPYPLVGVYGIKAKPNGISSYRHSSGVCSSMWLSSVGTGDGQTVL